MVVEKPKWRKAITCPSCEKEYEISEVFIPDKFFGQAKINQKQIESDYKESYVCDRCGNSFDVIAYLKFNTTLTPVKSEFEQDVILPLIDSEDQSNKINLI